MGFFFWSDMNRTLFLILINLLGVTNALFMIDSLYDGNYATAGINAFGVYFTSKIRGPKKREET